MKQEELKELIDLIAESGMSEFMLEQEGATVKIKHDVENQMLGLFPMQTSVPQIPDQLSAAIISSSVMRRATLHMVKSPIVGIFHESASFGARPFINVGDVVKAGQVMGMIGGVSLTKEIEADATGEVIERLAAEGQVIESGRALFAIRLCE